MHSVSQVSKVCNSTDAVDDAVDNAETIEFLWNIFKTSSFLRLVDPPDIEPKGL